jgi:hypothetical protein
MTRARQRKGFGSPLRLAMVARRSVGGGAQAGGCVRAWRNGASRGASERRAAAGESRVFWLRGEHRAETGESS